MEPAGTDRPGECPRCGHPGDRLEMEPRSGDAVRGTQGGFTLGARPKTYYWVTCKDCKHQFFWPQDANL